MSADTPTPSLWDTPTPLWVVPGPLYPSHLPLATSAVYRTISMRRTQGITFFCALGKLFAVHNHTVAAPDAVETYHNHIGPRRQPLTVWIHVPVAQVDSLQNLLVRSDKDHGIYFIVRISHYLPFAC